MPLTPEDVAYWYLRLNGFLLLSNFLVHGDRKGDSRTEIDQLGVRFRYRREHLARPMKDADWINEADSTIVVFCDAKAGARDFNDAWKTGDRNVMESFLALVGVVPKKRWNNVARELYAKGRARVTPRLVVTTLLLHEDKDRQLHPHWPDAPRVQLTEALRFIHERFAEYHNEKVAHGQWMPSGHRIWDVYSEHRYDSGKFISIVAREIGAI